MPPSSLKKFPPNWVRAKVCPYFHGHQFEEMWIPINNGAYLNFERGKQELLFPIFTVVNLGLSFLGLFWTTNVKNSSHA